MIKNKSIGFSYHILADPACFAMPLKEWSPVPVPVTTEHCSGVLTNQLKLWELIIRNFDWVWVSFWVSILITRSTQCQLNLCLRNARNRGCCLVSSRLADSFCIVLPRWYNLFSRDLLVLLAIYWVQSVIVRDETYSKTYSVLKETPICLIFQKICMIQLLL